LSRKITRREEPEELADPAGSLVAFEVHPWVHPPAEHHPVHVEMAKEA